MQFYVVGRTQVECLNAAICRRNLMKYSTLKYGNPAKHEMRFGRVTDIARIIDVKNMHNARYKNAAEWGSPNEPRNPQLSRPLKKYRGL